MKKKSLFLLFACISAILAVVASNRMTDKSFISENVEALSSGDDDLVPVRWSEQLYAISNLYHMYYGYSTYNKNEMWNGLPKCVGEKHMCARPTNMYCWDVLWVNKNIFRD